MNKLIARDLVKGNLFLFSEDNQEPDVVRYDGKLVWFTDAENEFTYTRKGTLAPIPLTPEILEKTEQIEKDGVSENFYCFKKFTIKKEDDFWHIGTEIFTTQGTILFVLFAKLNFVHELQNVIHASGEELEINL